MFSLPSYVTRAIALLEAAGHEAYVVGGAVRDILRGHAVNDYDLTTSATPDEMKAVFKDFRTVETGIAHGTLTVLIEDTPLEITTYRIDCGYTDLRHPDSVLFTRSLKEDAARRDFTVNAMAYHPSQGVRDFFGGEADLKARVIRAVGDSERRFSEDALRILRALRFAAVLDFTIEEGTQRAMRAKKDGLLSVSPERVREELSKLLCGVSAVRVLRDYGDILAVLLPELIPLFGFDQKNSHHAFDLWEHTVRTVGAIEPLPHLRLAALLHDVGKPDCMTVGADGEGHFYGHAAKSEQLSADILSRLRFDNKTRDAVLLLIKYHDLVPDPDSRQFARLRSRFGDGFLFDWLALVRADRTSQMPTLSAEKDEALVRAEEAARALLDKEERLSIAALRIGGEDLKKCGVSPGKEMGRLLSDALDALLDGKVENEKEALLAYLGLTPVECERKFLIRYPDVSMLLSLGAVPSEIEQTYLLSKKGVTARVRRRAYPERTVYFHTQKRRLTPTRAEEHEKEITKEEYEALLLQKDPLLHTIKKRRYALPYGTHTLEIDLYPFWTRQAVLEVELSEESEAFEVPKEIMILREVSGEKRYKNVFLAKEIPEEEP